MEVLCAWLNRPHMRKHYQTSPASLDDVRGKYTPRLDARHSTRCHIATVDGQPVGKLQCYLVCDYPQFRTEIGVDGGVAVDYFIGEESCLGRGLGKALLCRYVADVVPRTFPEERVCYVCHAETNQVAIRCSVGAGFRQVGCVVEEGKPSVLLAYESEKQT